MKGFTTIPMVRYVPLCRTTHPNGVNDYNSHNPKTLLRRVQGVPPVRVFAEVFGVAKGEWELRDFLSAAINELQQDGTIDRILSKYETVPGAILRVATPYASPNKQ